VVQSMVGALNKLPVAASGILFFGDPATFANVSSILVGFFAGLVVRQRSLLPWR
jgi:GDP-mannose transporter